MQKVLGHVSSLTEENKTLKRDIIAADARIEQLEAHNRKANLIITGIPPTSWSEATSQPTSDDTALEHASQTEKVVLQLVENQLHIPIMPQEISITHQLSKKKESTEPAPIIVNFTTFKMWDAVYKARFNLKGTRVRSSSTRILRRQRPQYSTRLLP